MTSHTHTQRPLVSDINSEAWRLALTVRAAQELREAALYGQQPPPAPPYSPPSVFTGPYLLLDQALTSLPGPRGLCY
jgi:hypothetical protein